MWELFCTVSVGARFDVCLGPVETEAFVAAVLDDAQKILAAFARIDVSRSEAGNAEDKAMILGAAKESKGALDGLNATAVSTLRRWLLDFVRGLAWRT